MNTQALYDLSPLARMMAFGIVLAAVPLLWVAWRKRNGSGTQRLHALTLVTLFLTFDLVLFGAFTRLSDSGLGCPDWPGCYGHASPMGAQADIAVAQSAMPTGPVTRGKAWIEMVHRYLATGVGVLILVLAVASWLAPGRKLAAICRRGYERGAKRCFKRHCNPPVARHRHLGMGVRAGRFWRAHRHNEAVSRHRHAAPSRPSGAA